jgi:hypothetical protein
MLQSLRQAVTLLLFVLHLCRATTSGDGSLSAATPPQHSALFFEDDGIFTTANATLATPPEEQQQQKQQQQQQQQQRSPRFLFPRRLFQQTTSTSLPKSKEVVAVSQDRPVGLFKKFKFKGYGLSFVKSLTSWSQVGLGVRIPITPNFPEYDSNTALPRVGAVSGVWWELDSGFQLRGSVSISVPIYVMSLFAAVLADMAGFKPDAITDRLRKSKARDSIRRVGMTMSVRYVPSGPKRGVCCAVGPWFFYVPGVKIMSRLLPFLFFFPALLTALVNTLFDFDAHSARFISSSIAAADVAAVAAAAQVGGMHPHPLNNETETAPPLAPPNQKTRSFGWRYWLSAWLTWCATKTTGLGLNTGETFNLRSTHVDASMGSSVLFDIAPFFPLEDGLMLPDLGSITYMQRAWRTFFNEGAWSWPWTRPKRRQNLGLGQLQQRTQTPIQTSGVQRRRDLASIDDKEEDEEQEEEQEEQPSYQDETDKDNTRPPGARGARRRASQQIFKKA